MLSYHTNKIIPVKVAQRTALCYREGRKKVLMFLLLENHAINLSNVKSMCLDVSDNTIAMSYTHGPTEHYSLPTAVADTSETMKEAQSKLMEVLMFAKHMDDHVVNGADTVTYPDLTSYKDDPT